MDAATAARYGLVERGPARAEGLVDRFGRGHTYLRISVTERCNLRCAYCMPEEGVPLLPKDTLLSFEEIERLAALFVRLGVTKVRLTGGEPLVRRDIEQLVARVGALKQGLPAPVGSVTGTALGPQTDGHRLGRLLMTTNGLRLQQYLARFRAAGLDALNLSLDTLRPDRFRALTRRDGLDETLAAIRGAVAAGFKVKVNAVAMRGVNEDEIVDLARAFAGELGIEMRYIEYMPFDGNHWSDAQLLPASRIRALLEQEFALEPLGLDLGEGGTAQIHLLTDKAGRRLPGRVGIISTMSEPFCSTCSRLRLTADGNLRWCLLDEGEVALRDPLRDGATDAEVAGLIEQALGRKRTGHAPAEELLRGQASGPSRSMIRIGG
jgi:cyclic pyranopterin phosphate synthase